MVVTCRAFVHHRERQARVDAAAVDDHRAGAALALVAALLGAGQVQVLAQRVEQGGARVELQRARRAVHLERDARDDGGSAAAAWAAAESGKVPAAVALAPAIRRPRRVMVMSSELSIALPPAAHFFWNTSLATTLARRRSASRRRRPGA